MSNMRAFGHREQVPEVRPVPAAPVSEVPMPLTSFVGRDSELREILSVLDDEGTRLLTLTGPGGVGKTRLCLEVARRVEQDFADGVRFLPFASERRPEQVPSAIARAVAVQDRRDRSLFESLVDTLRNRHLLLVLDNYEHLLDVPPVWLVDLLVRCPRIKVLVTSRIALNISGERRYLVPPMAIPPVADATLVESPAVTLFVHRARSIRSSFALTPENASSIGEICRRLDGLPLAIELAAGRIGMMSPKEIHAHLTGRSRLLAGGLRDAPQRLRSMRDAIAWGHELLTTDAQRAFRELAVFKDGFTLEAAEATVDSRSLDAATAVADLVDASLLQASHGTGQETRYLMLETIREFGLEQLAESGDEATVRHRHADWCLSLAQRAGPVDPVQDVEWFDRLEAERADMTAAIAWLDETERLDDLATLVIKTRWLWYLPGREAEGLGWFERLLHRHPTMSDVTRSDALCWAGHLAQMLGRPDATDYLERALLLARDVNDAHRQGEVTVMLAVMAEDHGDYDGSDALLRSAKSLFEQAGSDWSQRTVDYHLGVVAYGNGKLAQAASILESTQAAAESAGDPLIPVWTRNFLALIACERGDAAQATALLAQRPVDLVAGHRHDRTVFMGTVGVVACACGEYRCAARLFGAVASTAVMVMLPERAAFDRAAATARRSIGDDAYDAELEVGGHMRLGELEAEISDLLAGGVHHDVSASSASLRRAADLTRREHEVLKLLAEGQTNQEIADALFLSTRTVANHIDHILSKLDARSRTAAVAFAIRNGLA